MWWLLAALGAVSGTPLVYNLGLPKTGSTTLHHFMQACYDKAAEEDTLIRWQLGQDTQGEDGAAALPPTGRSCHWVLDQVRDRVDSPDQKPIRICDVIRDAHNQSEALLDTIQGGNSKHGCSAITQGDCLCNPRYLSCPDPYLPQISHLIELDEQNPGAKFVLMVRESEAWVRSVASHIGAGGKGSTMLTRLQAGDIPGLPPGQPVTEGFGMVSATAEGQRALVVWQLRHYDTVKRHFRGR
jgi:hypothetical protein